MAEARNRVKNKIDNLNHLMEYTKQMPYPPNIPNLYSIGASKQYPLDFNMKVQIMKEDEKVSRQNNERQKIEKEILMPLNSLYVKLEELRGQLKNLKTVRDSMKDGLKDVDEENMEEDEKEEYGIKKEEFGYDWG